MSHDKMPMAETLEMAEGLALHFDMKLVDSPLRSHETIMWVMQAMAQKLDDKQEFERTMSDLQFDLKRAIDMRDYHEKTSQTYRLRLRALSAKVQRYCRKLVFQSLAHGQKNGAILMLAALVEGEGMDDTGTNDIPF
jgi:hypothetical protein